MDDITREDKNVPLEPVQGLLFEMVTIIDGVGPLYRPNLAFDDVTSQDQGAVRPAPAKL